jgi:hypothetical protein
MSEFRLIVTLCAIPTISDTPYGAAQPSLSSHCAEYRVDGSFASVEACRLHQVHLNDLPLEGREITAYLCTARTDRARLRDLPLLSAALGDHA